MNTEAFPGVSWTTVERALEHMSCNPAGLVSVSYFLEPLRERASGLSPTEVLVEIVAIASTLSSLQARGSSTCSVPDRLHS